MYQLLIDRRPDAPEQSARYHADSATLLHGASQATVSLRARLRSLAPYFRTALITGEPGVGKRRVARELHRLSHPEGALISYRPGSSRSLPRDAEVQNEAEWSELLHSAEGGTLVVEEVADLSPGDQARLLQLLREPGWRNAGLSRAQVVGISRHEPRALLTTGQLRQDLHTMLTAVAIRVQPLRSRPEDLEEIAIELLAEAAAEHQLAEPRLAPEALDTLRRRTWPGNVAELRTVLRHAIQGGREPVVTAESLLPLSAEPSAGSSARGSMLLQDAIDAHVTKVLASCGGNKLKTAELLGVSRSTLYRMLETSSSPVRGGDVKVGSGSLRP